MESSLFLYTITVLVVSCETYLAGQAGQELYPSTYVPCMSAYILLRKSRNLSRKNALETQTCYF